MSQPRTATVTTTTGVVVTFVYNPTQQLFICQTCTGGVRGERHCLAHAERAHAVER